MTRTKLPVTTLASLSVSVLTLGLTVATGAPGCGGSSSGGTDAGVDQGQDQAAGAGGSGGTGGVGGSGGSGGTGGVGGAGGSGGSGGSGGTGGSGGVGGSGGTGGGGGAGGGGGMDAPAGDAGLGTMLCGGGKTFPAFDKSCSDDKDCTFGIHQTNCCGDTLAMGINGSEKAAFDSAEAECSASWPGCGCVSHPTVTEDGSMTNTGSPDEIAVKCEAGSCTTYLKACGGVCGKGTTCMCCASKPANVCVCSTTCKSDDDCKDPAAPKCQTSWGMPFCTAASVTCGIK